MVVWREIQGSEPFILPALAASGMEERWEDEAEGPVEAIGTRPSYWKGGNEMKRCNFFTVVIFLLGIILPNLSFSLDLYEDFSGASINLTNRNDVHPVHQL